MATRSRRRATRRPPWQGKAKPAQDPLATSMGALHSLLRGIEQGTASFSQSDAILPGVLRQQRERGEHERVEPRKQRKARRRSHGRTAPLPHQRGHDRGRVVVEAGASWQRKQDERRARSNAHQFSRTSRPGQSVFSTTASAVLSSTRATVEQPPHSPVGSPSHGLGERHGVSEWHARYQSPLSAMLNPARRAFDPRETAVAQYLPMPRPGIAKPSQLVIGASPNVSMPTVILDPRVPRRRRTQAPTPTSMLSPDRDDAASSLLELSEPSLRRPGLPSASGAKRRERKTGRARGQGARKHGRPARGARMRQRPVSPLVSLPRGRRGGAEMLHPAGGGSRCQALLDPLHRVDRPSSVASLPSPPHNASEARLSMSASLSHLASHPLGEGSSSLVQGSSLISPLEPSVLGASASAFGGVQLDGQDHYPRQGIDEGSSVFDSHGDGKGKGGGGTDTLRQVEPNDGAALTETESVQGGAVNEAGVGDFDGDGSGVVVPPDIPPPVLAPTPSAASEGALPSPGYNQPARGNRQQQQLAPSPQRWAYRRSQAARRGAPSSPPPGPVPATFVPSWSTPIASPAVRPAPNRPPAGEAANTGAGPSTEGAEDGGSRAGDDQQASSPSVVGERQRRIKRPKFIEIDRVPVQGLYQRLHATSRGVDLPKRREDVPLTTLDRLLGPAKDHACSDDEEDVPPPQPQEEKEAGDQSQPPSVKSDNGAVGDDFDTVELADVRRRMARAQRFLRKQGEDVPKITMRTYDDPVAARRRSSIMSKARRASKVQQLQAAAAAAEARRQQEAEEAAALAQAEPTANPRQEAMRKRIGVHKELELKHEGKVVKQMLEVTATLPQHLRDRLALNTAIIEFKQKYGKHSLRRIIKRLKNGKLKAGMDKWIAVTRYLTITLRRKGALEMQRVFRGFVARRRVDRMRWEKAEAERIAAEELALFRRMLFVSATRLQRFCRRKMREHHAKVHRARVKAAMRIQRAWQAFRKRQWFYGICMFGRMRRRRAAALIQRSFRMYKIRRRMALLRAMARAEEHRRAKEAEMMAMRQRFIDNGAATTITLFWQGRRALWRMRAILRFRRTVFATKIQRWHRERQALKWQARFRKKKAKQFAASTKINAVARGFMARKVAKAKAAKRARQRAVLAERAERRKQLEEEEKRRQAKTLAGRVKAAKEMAAKAKEKAEEAQKTTFNAKVAFRTAKLFNPLTRKKFRNESATKIQAAFRGMRGRQRAAKRRDAKRQRAEEHIRKKHDGMARRIQRVWHGHQTRRWLFNIRSRKYILKIEAAYYAYRQRRFMKVFRRQRQAAVDIQRMWKGRQTYRQYRSAIEHGMLRSRTCVRIQAAVRRWLAQRYVREQLIPRLQFMDDLRVVGQLWFDRTLKQRMTQHVLWGLFDVEACGFASQPLLRFAKHGIGLQKRRHLVQEKQKARLEHEAQVRAAREAKFGLAPPAVPQPAPTGAVDPRVASSRPKPGSRKARAAAARGKKGGPRRASLPMLVEEEVVALAAMTPPKGILRATFNQLCEQAALKDKKQALDQSTFIRFVAGFRGVIGLGLTKPEVDVVFTSTKLEKNIRTMDYDHFKRALIKIATRKYPWRNGDKPGMCGTTGEVASMARLLRRFWGSGGSVWRRLEDVLHKHVEWSLGATADKLRTWYGRGGAMQDASFALALQKRIMEQRAKEALAVRVQSIVRGMLGRKRAAYAAKRVFKKYLTEDRSAVYYYNTATKAKQWHKPYLLHGNNDVEEIPMPTNDEKYLVYCEQCEGDSPNMAVKYCNNCQSAMCEEHDKLTHRRGRRARHIRTDLEVCRVCDYQNASRKCKHCHDARFQCDTCFNYRHDHFPKRAHHEAVLLVSLCIECEKRAVQWRCDYCEETYCTICFKNTHRKGTLRLHTYTVLPYYPADLGAEQRKVDETEILRQRLREEADRQEMRRQARMETAATRIQHSVRLWLKRRVMYAHAALGAKEVRVRQRQEYMRGKEDKEVRSKVGYKMLKLMGIAPELATDTEEEKQSKRKVPVWKKLGAAAFLGGMEVPEWVEQGQKCKVVGGKYKGMDGIVGSNEPHQLEGSGKARVLLVRLGRTEAIPIRQLQHVFDKKNLVSAVRKRQEAAAERKAAIKAAKERGENHYAFEEEYDRKQEELAEASKKPKKRMFAGLAKRWQAVKNAVALPEYVPLSDSEGEDDPEVKEAERRAEERRNRRGRRRSRVMKYKHT